MAKKKPAKEKAGVPPPYALAMVITDAIWRDPGTGKRTIIGCFSTLFARQFPVIHPIMAVYIALTDGRGKVNIKFQVIDVDEEEEPITKTEGEVEFPDPRAVIEMDLHMPNLTFPKPGEYRFQLFAGDEFVIERRLLVIQVPSEEKQQ